MRLLLLVAHTSEGEVQHRYVAQRIADSFPGELKAIIVATGIRKSTSEKFRRWRHRYTLSQIVSRSLVHTVRRLALTNTRRQNRYRAILFPAGEDGRLPRQDLLVKVPSHNGPECLQAIEAIAPDLMVVYGTLIIGRNVRAASKRIINLHTGWSPRYRGSDTIFWPLHNAEPEYVGVTVHRLEAGVDSGPILARGRPRIDPDDNEDRLFAKAVQLGADLLCRAILRERNGIARPVAQNLADGREYRSVDRTLAAELRTSKLLREGLLRSGYETWQEEF